MVAARTNNNERFLASQTEAAHNDWQVTASYADYMLDEALDFNLRTMSLEELAKLVAEKIDARKRPLLGKKATPND